MSTGLPSSESVGRIVDGRFKLLHWLGGSEHSSVFLTELAGDPPGKAAIKLVAADDARNAQWAAAKSLLHPHLIRLFEWGRWETDGKEVQYAVTEYAEEVLAEILAERPLTPAETAEMLPAIVDALAYLHACGLVHGGLTPANILAAGDRLKVSVDGLETAGEHGGRFHPPTEYDAPEMATEALSPAMDVWSLGAVTVKALTRETPAWNRAGGGEPVVPSSVPEPLAGIARECLRVDPARRCTLAEVKARLARAAARAPIAVPDAGPARAPVAAPAPEQSPASAGRQAEKARSRAPMKTTVALAVLIAGVAIVGVVIAGAVMRSHRAQAPPAAVTQDSVPSPGASGTQQPAAETPDAEGSVVKGAVAHQVLPDAPQAAMETIDGHFRVKIRVDADPEGNVSNAAIDRQGPSRYFAEFALKAAREWKFRPAQKGGRAVPSTWTLDFVFGREGVTAEASEVQP